MTVSHHLLLLYLKLCVETTIDQVLARRADLMLNDGLSALILASVWTLWSLGSKRCRGEAASSALTIPPIQLFSLLWHSANERVEAPASSHISLWVLAWDPSVIIMAATALLWVVAVYCMLALYPSGRLTLLMSFQDPLYKTTVIYIHVFHIFHFKDYNWRKQPITTSFLNISENGFRSFCIWTLQLLLHL